MNQHAGATHSSQAPSDSGGRPAIAPERLPTTVEFVAGRIRSWATSHGIGGDQVFVASLSRTVHKALAEYFRLVTCDCELAIVSRSMPDGNAMVLFIPAELPWNVAYNQARMAAEISPSLLCRLLGRVREERTRGQRNRAERHVDKLRTWDFARDDLPLEAFVPHERPDTWEDRLWSHLVTLRPAPGQQVRPPSSLLRELGKECADLPAAHAHLGLRWIVVRCDLDMRSLVLDDPRVRVREYYFAIEAASQKARGNRLRWARTFPALWGLRTHAQIRELIDAGQPVIKPAAALLDCPPAVLRRLRTVEHSVGQPSAAEAMLAYDLPPMNDEFDAGRVVRGEWEADVARETVDIPLLLLHGLAELPADKLPPPEALPRLNRVLDQGLRGGAFIPAVIGASFFAARLLTAARPGAITWIPPSFRPLLKATRGDWETVGPQVSGITNVHIVGIRDFVTMLADALVLPYVLRTSSWSGQPHLAQELRVAAREQMALLLAAQWHIGSFLRHSAEWHKALGITLGRGHDAWLGDFAWPAWFKRVKASNGIIIEPLCSSAALREEGALMHHCVGGYDRECLAGRTQVFSVRSAQGERLSTLQLNLHKAYGGTFRFSQAQHLAACNSEPPPEAVQAVKKLLTAMNGGKVPHRAGAALEHRGASNGRHICGFDHTSDTAWEQARAGALPYLPAELRKLPAMELGARVADFRMPQRSVQPEPDEPEVDDDDFERRVLRWIR
jgi:hypothetical protein